MSWMVHLLARRTPVAEPRMLIEKFKGANEPLKLRCWSRSSRRSLGSRQSTRTPCTHARSPQIDDRPTFGLKTDAQSMADSSCRRRRPAPGLKSSTPFDGSHSPPRSYEHSMPLCPSGGIAKAPYTDTTRLLLTLASRTPAHTVPLLNALPFAAWCVPFPTDVWRAGFNFSSPSRLLNRLVLPPFCCCASPLPSARYDVQRQPPS
mmetsp:Transcript_51923/g.119444  ORF Transcript_51923/g.119444 Transcript_51923/m.119444 type:complete len:205 (-) Transcript_51923:85-699(-)